VGEARRFLKIPFAKPPLGALRFALPVKNDAWEGVRHERELAKPCAQLESIGSPASSNEDCLYLNVWAPKLPVSGAPVMVWIHGGGNFAGSAFDKVPRSNPPKIWFDGQSFAEKHGIVLVTINYRLGPFGFFAHPALAEEGVLGNQGLHDQRAALSWVRDNVAAFGGDPGNVTIFGESAGSADVCFHVVSAPSRGLFHRAISQSGGCTSGPMGAPRAPTRQEAAAGLVAFGKALGCEGPEALACLRGKSIDEILAITRQPTPSSAKSAPPAWTFNVVVDGEGGFVPDSPRALFELGEVAKVPYLLGSNSDEGTLFTYRQPPPKTEKDYRAALEARFGKAAPKLAAHYSAKKFDGDYGAALARAIGDSGLVCGTHETALYAVKGGLPVFMYNFNVPWNISPEGLKAAHAAEISFVFGDPHSPEPNPAEQAIADAIHAYWARFARTGDPNFEGAPAKWPAFAPDAAGHDQRLQLDAQWQVLTDFRHADCKLWRELAQAAHAKAAPAAKK
jgi:para-nitrobenzyl esterase